MININHEDHLLTILHDLTETKRLEGAIRKERDRAVWLARLPDENPSPVARVASNGIVLYHNPAAAERPEWACAVDQLLPEPLLHLVIQAMARGQEVEQDVQLGARFYLVSVMPIPGEAYANLYGRDITDRKQAEQALQDSQTRYRRLIENANEGIWTIDANHITDFVNQRGAQILGYTVEEMLDKPAFKVQSMSMIAPGFMWTGCGTPPVGCGTWWTACCSARASTPWDSLSLGWNYPKLPLT